MELVAGQADQAERVVVAHAVVLFAVVEEAVEAVMAVVDVVGAAAVGAVGGAAAVAVAVAVAAMDQLGTVAEFLEWTAAAGSSAGAPPA